MAGKLRTVETVVARIASRSHGVVTRRQLLAAGVSEDEIDHRIAAGALLREHRGVYRVGHRAPSIEARYLAAVRACGEGALLSGPAAAHIWGLLKGAAPPPQVITPTERRIAGINTRRSRKIDPTDATTCRGIPITTVPFTLIALAAQLDAEALARACHEAGVRYGTTPRQVEGVLLRRPNAPGTRQLRAVLRGDVKVTLSKLEQHFLELLHHEGLELPQTNRRAGARRVDCRWPSHRLTVELDGYRYHHSRHAWEQDRRREREARARGDEFRRYTYGDVLEQPALMLAELRELLLASTEGALPDAPSVVAVPRTKSWVS
jgi:very-short-patch-repair endonuclease